MLQEHHPRQQWIKAAEEKCRPIFWFLVLKENEQSLIMGFSEVVSSRENQVSAYQG